MAKKKKEKSVEDLIEHIRDAIDELENKIIDTEDMKNGMNITDEDFDEDEEDN
jgi:frataxin-like iron-binding protein CyaY